MARDCTSRRGDPSAFGPPSGFGGPAQFGPAGAAPSTGNKAFDSEYASLMAELGEGGGGSGRPGGGAGPWARNDGAPAGQIAGVDPNSNIPPWRRPEMWQTPTANQGYRPPYGGVGPAAYAGASPWTGSGASP